ncbi:MAG: RagB/SusD family nutrient uptake outer membrane protein [Bacteroidota bacterium]
MKNIIVRKSIFWLLALPVIAGIGGCKKYLDRQPLSEAFSDLTGAQQLDGISYAMYNTVQTYAGLTTLPWIDFNSIRDDDAQKGSSTTDGAEIDAEFETFKYTKDDWATDTYWNDHYYLIGQANQLLYTADSLKLTGDLVNRHLGEAYFMRAFGFYELVKAYGDVPLINFYYTKAADGVKPKSPAVAIYAQIDADLAKAVQFLPVSWKDAAGANAYPGRLSKGAAMTLWAQTYLFRSNWVQVAGLCKQVMALGQYSLNSSFVNVFQDGAAGIPSAGKNGVESIWETQNYVGAGGTPNNGSPWGQSQGVRQGGASTVWNLGWGWNTPTDNLVGAWDNTDPRKAATILYSGQSDGGPSTGGYGATLPVYAPGTGLDRKYWNKKVYIGNDPAMRSLTNHLTDAGCTWINHRILRYADVVLMLAEASNETADGATAAANLELVRNRASGNLGIARTVLPFIPFADQAQMRAAIKNERRWEFAMEGYRFYDLVRWGDALSVLGSLGYTPRCALYPIPQPAINSASGVLVQNPNW